MAWTGPNEMQAVARTGELVGGDNGHSLVWSGEVVWCRICARYARMRAHIRGIGGICRGAPVRKGPDDYGGMWGQLQKLRMGKHPKTGKPLPAPVDCKGEEVTGHRRYARLDRRCIADNALSIVPFDESNRFTPYVPRPARALKPNEGEVSQGLDGRHAPED